jgi:hypothetical protein
MRVNVWRRGVAAAAAVVGAVACGGRQSTNAAPPPTLQDISLATITVSRGRDRTPDADAPGAVPRAVQQALFARHTAVLQCYESVIHQTADATGRLAMTATFSGDGAVQRVDSRPEDGASGINAMHGCVEDAVHAARMETPWPAGVRVRWTYAFANTPIDIRVSTPEAVGPRRGARRAAPASADGGVPATPTGVLTEGEVLEVVRGGGDRLSRCYATLLRGHANAAGNVTLNFNVGADGAVSEATTSDVADGLASMNDCLTGFAGTLQFRGTGTGANVHLPMTFAR